MRRQSKCAAGFVNGVAPGGGIPVFVGPLPPPPPPLLLLLLLVVRLEVSVGEATNVIALLLRVVVFVTVCIDRGFEVSVVGGMEYEVIEVGGSLLILAILLVMEVGMAGDSGYSPSRSRDVKGLDPEVSSGVAFVLVAIFAIVVAAAKLVVNLPLALVNVFVMTALPDPIAPPTARDGVSNAPCWCSGIRTSAGAEGEVISVLLKRRVVY